MKSYDNLNAGVEAIYRSIASSPYLNEIDLVALKESVKSSQPIKHICIDGMWKESFLELVRSEVEENKEWAGEKQFYGSKHKLWQDDWSKMPTNVNHFLSYLNKPLVLSMVEFLFEENGLIPDPYLEGGGIHSTGENGFLKLHADFNWHEKLKLYRRINILIYLNKDWNSKYGGQIELANRDLDGKFLTQISLEPIFNRTLIFITDDESYHGQPNPVKHSFKKRRDSIAAYYYVAEKPFDTSDLKRSVTNYYEGNGKRSNPALLKRLYTKFLHLIS
jgi:Rps23 Pro-64 3,4-dihydroxylase Tpa1-like proline 4-hydroxylase